NIDGRDCCQTGQFSQDVADGALTFVRRLNAQKLCDTQHMMQQILLSLVHALYEGNPQPVFANTEKLNDAVEELRQLLDNHHDLKVVETPIYGYVWLNMETAHQLELLSNLICRALRK
uniref:hypothetical protein n=3 Tax=Shigella TaxID=620 RepID=UPI0020902DC4